MKNIKHFLTAAAAFFLPLFSLAQDIHFSQFYMAPLFQNPAMTGAVWDMEAIVNYKDQWQSIGAPYKTMATSFDMKLNRKKAKKGLWAGGINFFNDKAGDAKMSSTQANLNFAYHVFLSKYSNLGAGFQFGFAQRSISYSDLSWGNQFNGNNFDVTLPSGEPAGKNTFTYADMGAGVVWHYNNTHGAIKVTDNHDLRFTIGASVFHPTRPNYAFYNETEKLYAKFVVHGNGLVSIPNSNLAFAPGFMYYRQGPTQEIYFGTLLRYKLKQDSKYTGFEKGAAFSVGAFYRTQDAIAATMLLEYANYAIGMSYDVNTSPLKAASNARGGFEISLRYISPNPFLYKQFFRQISKPIID